MAIDEAIGRAVSERLVPPTLRFYAWDPPCVSLGKHQALADVDAARCAALGYHIVRRPTGGRAILHTDELTYSVVAPADHPVMAGMVLDTYLRLARGLVAGLRRLGIPAETAPGANRAGADASAACFEAPSAYEIIVNGRKLLGSAQNRRAGFVLQHGSLPLTGDLARLIDCLALAETDADALRRSLAGHATTAEEAAGRPIAFADAMAALAESFAETFAATLVPGELTEAEQAWAAELARDKYAHPDWAGRLYT
ncbi:MAG: octanoyltransferase [Chloroflexi bacterium HGW-Chloroflexi-1]|nr:MAG: octanoyltransferase [Chloroflexi bacterium HGW-Chloroflexi-1]